MLRDPATGVAPVVDITLGITEAVVGKTRGKSVGAVADLASAFQAQALFVPLGTGTNPPITQCFPHLR